MLLLLFSILSFQQLYSKTPNKVIIVVSANDCYKCMSSVENIIQNSSKLDSLFLYFESKLMKEDFEKDHRNKKNVFFIHHKILADHLLINGQSTVHIYKGLMYKRLLLKNVVNVNSDIRFNFNYNSYNIEDIIVEPESIIFSSTDREYLIYNKFSNFLYLYGISIDGELIQQSTLNYETTEKDYGVVYSFYKDNSRNNIDSILDYNSSIELLKRLRLPVKTVSSISFIKNKIFIFTQLYLCKIIVNGDETELVHQGYDFVYTYIFDKTSNNIYFEEVMPLNEAFVYNPSRENKILINPFGKHQLVNNSWVYSPAITYKDPEIITFDPNSIGILYNEKLITPETRYFSLPNDYHKHIDTEVLKQTITNNSILLTDFKDHFFLYNRVLNRAINLQSENELTAVLDVEFLVRELTSNTIDLNIERIMAGEILDSYLYLCFYEYNVGLKLLKFNMTTLEYEINPLKSLAKSGKLIQCSIIEGRLNYCAYDFDKEIITIYKYSY